jgi:SP family general alpha glucoside:H+ symporter-like MFS transporter
MASELPSSRLRARSIAFGRMFYACNYAVQSQLTPRMVSRTAWNWSAKSGFFFLGCNVLITIWAYFRMPETGGFSFAELEILFANKVPARKFTQVEIHDEAAAGNTKFEEADEEEGYREPGEKAVEQQVEDIASPTLVR